MSNAVQQNQQARLTPMSQPTAPSTPPTQQQQQPQLQGAPQYTVQLSQQGIPPTAGGAGNPRSTQYRPQSAQPRRQQPMNQQYIYQPQIGGMPYGFVLPHGAHVRAPATFGYMPFPQVYNNQYVAAAQNYQQIQAPPNGQQRPSAQPQASAPAMAQPQTSEYSYQSMYAVEQPVMQAPPVPTQQQAPPPQAQPPKTAAKKIGSKAIKIINPVTGKNIFDEGDSGEGGATSGSVDKAITASINELNKDEAVDKEQQEKEKEPSTPVVSAISDGPSVDITPKHQVNKGKKKPPEVIAAPPAPPAVLAPPPEAPKPVEVEVEVVEPEVVPKDDENNDVEVAPAQIPAAPEPVIEKEVVVVPAPQPVLDVNDTNNNNYEEEKPEVEETKEVAAPVPQDSNNNSTDDKSIMTSPSIRAAPQEAASRKTSTVDGPIDYDDGQWSPANLAGKKYYTRDQLLKLKDLPIALAPPAMTKLPENVANVLMKNNKETLTNTLTQTMPPPGMAGLARGNVPFNDPINSLIAPKFMTNQMNNRNPYQKRPSQQGNKNQQGPGNRNSSQSGIIKMSLSLHDDVKLNEADNAWKPSHLVKKPELTEEERVTYDLLNRFRSMLNKLTAENFEVLVKEVKNYKIDTSERLDGVISLVFEKAISEPKFAPTYAILCREVSYINTAPSGEGQKKNTLKVKLITQCQREFERHKEESKVFNEIEEKLREIENAEVVKTRDDEKTRLEEEHYRVRQRANGTVKFIGELFKIDMLTSKIMRSCVDLLLQEITEEKIERVCKLLTTIGGKLEEAEGRPTLNKYFDQLNDMLRPTHQIIKSSRIKFEIQNLQDLRHNSWKSRRVEATPKTLDQIQNEMDQEQQMISFQTRQNSKDDRNRGGNYGGNNRNRQQQQDSDGWSVQQNKNSRSQPIQFKNIPLPTISGEAKIGGPANFQNFMVQNTNKFSGLPVDTDTDGPPRFGGGGGSKNSSMERNRDSRNYNYNNGDRGNAPYSGRSSGSGQGSRNSSRARDDSDGRGGPSRSLQAPTRQQQVPMAPSSSMSFSGAVKKEGVVAAPAKPMTREEVILNYEAMLAIVNDFRDDKFNVEDAMTKLKPLAINKDVLVEIYNKFLDRKDIDRENLMLIVCELMKTKKVSLDENHVALIDIMVFAPEMMCDVPRVYEYIAQFMGEF